MFTSTPEKNIEFHPVHVLNPNIPETTPLFIFFLLTKALSEYWCSVCQLVYSIQPAAYHRTFPSDWQGEVFNFEMLPYLENKHLISDDLSFVLRFTVQL